jgi:starvation-inducible DNA-binding protein
MQKTANTLSKNIRAKSVAVLNRHLAATIDLHAQVKQAHWNVRGPTFIAIHELFDKVADAIEGHSDTIAERAGVLGGPRKEPSRPPSSIRFWGGTGSASLTLRRTSPW